MENEVCTAIGTPNKALVMYWGKRNIKLNLPMNSSLSITLDEALNTRTSVLFSTKLKNDIMYLDGQKQELVTSSERKISVLRSTLDEVRKQSGIKGHALIVTQNSFPKSVGLASSASGAATFVYTVTKAAGLAMGKDDMSIMIRNISGSGCRSIFGGFSAWNKGTKSNGEDSYAYQVVDQNYWPEVIDVIGLVSSVKKKISSDEGHVITT
ncbi:MAG TPA: diphosphomevalonate decarboxylase, partial [Candidatus Baltobacteraceae bacterium]|nr:diphosphomevalonate decarboxylase [Candidatus Baltobacteraceae bacterium]